LSHHPKPPQNCQVLKLIGRKKNLLFYFSFTLPLLRFCVISRDVWPFVVLLHSAYLWCEMIFNYYFSWQTWRLFLEFGFYQRKLRSQKFKSLLQDVRTRRKTLCAFFTLPVPDPPYLGYCAMSQTLQA
jgi:hypothetical protein